MCIHIHFASDDFALFHLLAKCPKKNELLQLMSGIASKWYIIGEVLGIKYTYLASLQNKISRDIDKLAEVLQLWMDTMPKPVTWNTILQVMESPLIESKIIVMEMEKFLKCECSYSLSKILLLYLRTHLKIAMVFCIIKHKFVW